MALTRFPTAFVPFSRTACGLRRSEGVPAQEEVQPTTEVYRIMIKKLCRPHLPYPTPCRLTTLLFQGRSGEVETVFHINIDAQAQQKNFRKHPNTQHIVFGSTRYMVLCF